MTTALRLVEGSSMDKSKALDAALAQIERNFGKGSIMRLGKNNKALDVETVSTGSLGLDIALGIGGLPRGRVVEIYGPESSGKTTLALHCLAEAQKKGGICAFIDAEHALDPAYAKKLGVDIDNLLISQPDAGEQALEIASISSASRWPSFMIEPLPKARSIWASAASRALFLFSMPSFSTSFSAADIGLPPRFSHARVRSDNADKSAGSEDHCTHFVPGNKREITH